MNDYILIESISSKTHLQSAHCKDKVYTIKFGDRICEMSNFIESCFGNGQEVFVNMGDHFKRFVNWKEVTSEE